MKVDFCAIHAVQWCTQPVLSCMHTTHGLTSAREITTSSICAPTGQLWCHERRYICTRCVIWGLPEIVTLHATGVCFHYYVFWQKVKQVSLQFSIHTCIHNSWLTVMYSHSWVWTNTKQYTTHKSSNYTLCVQTAKIVRVTKHYRVTLICTHIYKS